MNKHLKKAIHMIHVNLLKLDMSFILVLSVTLYKSEKPKYLQ